MEISIAAALKMKNKTIITRITMRNSKHHRRTIYMADCMTNYNQTDQQMKCIKAIKIKAIKEKHL